MQQLAYYNGRVGAPEEMTVPFLDRVSFFGDGVYDATMSRNYHIYLLDEHIDRLYRSAAALRIEIPMTKAQMAATLNDLVSRMDTGNNFVYWQVTRGTGPRDHAFPEGAPNLWAYIFPREMSERGTTLTLISREDTRFFHCDVKTLNLIPSVMAAQAAREAGCDETVFHRGSRVTECAHSNIHILRGGVFRTAPADNLILPGIARAHLLSACARLGIPAREEPFTMDELREADEVIVSSSGSPCMRATALDGAPIGGRDPETLARLQDAVWGEFFAATN